MVECVRELLCLAGALVLQEHAIVPLIAASIADVSSVLERYANAGTEPVFDA